MGARGARRAQMTRPEVADQRPAGGFMHAPVAPLSARGAFEPLPCRKITVLYGLFSGVRGSTSSACADLRKRMHKTSSDVASGAYDVSVVQNGDFSTCRRSEGASGSLAAPGAACPLRGTRDSRRARSYRRQLSCQLSCAFLGFVLASAFWHAR